MGIEVKEAEGAVTLALDGEVDLAGAVALHEKALEIQALAKDVVVDLSGAVRLDISAIQVLLAMQEAQREHGMKLHIVSAPDTIIADCRLIGLQRLLGPQNLS